MSKESKQIEALKAIYHLLGPDTPYYITRVGGTLSKRDIKKIDKIAEAVKAAIDEAGQP